MIVIILEFAYPLVIRLQIRMLYITQQILGTDTQKKRKPHLSIRTKEENYNV